MIKQKTGFAGFYTLEITKPDGRVISHHFENLITDAGLEAIATGLPFIGKVWLVNQSTAPTIATRALPNTGKYVHRNILQQTATMVATANSATVKPYISYKTKVDFNPVSITGQVNKVAITFGSDVVFSMTDIKDGANNNATLFIGVDDVVVLTYELRIYIHPTAVTVNNVNFDKFGLVNVTIRPCKVNVAPNVEDVKLGFKLRPKRPVTDLRQATTTLELYNNVGYTGYSNAITGKVGSTDEPVNLAAGQLTEMTKANGKIYSHISVVLPRDALTEVGNYNAIAFDTTFGSYLLSFSKTLEKTIRNRYDLTIKVGFEIGRAL